MTPQGIVWVAGAMTSYLRAKDPRSVEDPRLAESHLPTLRLGALVRADRGDGRPLGEAFSDAMRMHAWSLSEVLAFTLRHHPTPAFRAHFDRIESYHFPAQADDPNYPWRRNGKYDADLLRQALHEAVEISGAKPGDYVDLTRLLAQPLRYNGVCLGVTFQRESSSGTHSPLIYLPPGIKLMAQRQISSLPEAPPVLSAAERRCLSILEEHLGLDDSMSFQDYVLAVNRSLREGIVEVLRRRWHAERPEGGTLEALISMLKNHPRPDVRHYYQSLGTHHYPDRGHGKSTPTTTNWPHLHAVCLEVLQFLACAHLKRKFLEWQEPAELLTPQEFAGVVTDLIPQIRKRGIQATLQDARMRYGAKPSYMAFHHEMVPIKKSIGEVFVDTLIKAAPPEVRKVCKPLRAYHLTRIQWNDQPQLLSDLAFELATLALKPDDAGLAQRLHNFSAQLARSGTQGLHVASHIARQTPLYFGLTLRKFRDSLPLTPHDLFAIGTSRLLQETSGGKALGLTNLVLPDDPKAPKNPWYAALAEILAQRPDVQRFWIRPDRR